MEQDQGRRPHDSPSLPASSGVPCTEPHCGLAFPGAVLPLAVTKWPLAHGHPLLWNTYWSSRPAPLCPTCLADTPQAQLRCRLLQEACVHGSGPSPLD